MTRSDAQKIHGTHTLTDGDMTETYTDAIERLQDFIDFNDPDLDHNELEYKESIERIAETLKWHEDGCKFKWFNEIPLLARNHLESYINTALDHYAEERMFHTAAYIQDIAESWEPWDDTFASEGNYVFDNIHYFLTEMVKFWTEGLIGIVNSAMCYDGEDFD